MSFFEPISGADFDEKLAGARAAQGAVIIDVRSAAEAGTGRIPGAIHIPLDQLPALNMDRATPLFLYSRSGQQSMSGCRTLEQLGFAHVTNLGGITDYTGALEK